MTEDLVNMGRARILVVDDVQANLNLVSETLEGAGFVVSVATSGLIAMEIAKINPPDLILLDIMMPDIDGFETCRQLKLLPETKHIPILFISARDEVQNIVEGFQLGAVDYISKPFRNEELLARVETHLRITMLTNALRQKNEELESVNQRLVQEIVKREKAEEKSDTAEQQLNLRTNSESEHWGLPDFVGRSRTFRDILNRIKQLHDFGDVNVLIAGESGTGKELIARAIHAGSKHASAPFIPVNCSAIPSELAESLFFGHKKGSFSGATTDKKGFFELANGGTLFLDEVGEMPRTLQPKLLRVLEDSVVNPIGSSKQIEVKLRVIAASNIDFQQRLQDGGFREDLYFRLARFTVRVPPLRERREDIPLLVNHFLNLFAKEMNRPLPVISPSAMEALKQYHYRGNVRELKNLIERSIIECGSRTIKLEHLLFFEEGAEGEDPTSVPSPAAASDSDSVEDIDANETRQRYENAMNRLQSAPFKAGTKESMARILNYLRDHAFVDNSRCRTLLQTEQMKASYILKKMHAANLLQGVGTGRWIQYRLP